MTPFSYQFYEMAHLALAPARAVSDATKLFYKNPMNPLTHTVWGRNMAASAELFERLTRRYGKPAFDLPQTQIDGKIVDIHEEIVWSKPFGQVIRFARQARRSDSRLLIVAPLSGHYATLLRDTVKTMLTGHKVYITDWKNARLVPLSEGEFHLDDYVNYVQEFIRYLQGQYGNVHVMSVCQPTVPVLAAVSLMASRGEKTPLSMTMMGGPIDASRSPTAVNNLAMNKSHSWFENNVIYRVPGNFPGAGRRVYPGFLQHTGFVAMNPDRHLNSHYDYFLDLVKGDNSSAESHRKFYDEYNAVLDMDADYYLETIQTVFQDFKLVHGTWEVKNPQGEIERVRPQDISTTALLTIEGELDDISGSGQTEAAHGLCANIPAGSSKHLEVQGAGHYGIFSGRRWRDVVYPCVRDFILAHHGTKAVSSSRAKPATRKAVKTVKAKAPARKTAARKTARRARA